MKDKKIFNPPSDERSFNEWYHNLTGNEQDIFCRHHVWYINGEDENKRDMVMGTSGFAPFDPSGKDPHKGQYSWKCYACEIFEDQWVSEPFTIWQHRLSEEHQQALILLKLGGK